MTNFKVWAKDPLHPELGQTELLHGDLKHCRTEVEWLKAMAKRFGGRDPYPYRTLTIERA